MTVRSRGADPPEEIKQLPKLKIIPGEINVGVNSPKSHNGGIVIETNGMEELEALGQEIIKKVRRILRD
jgi:hypothetical protein